MNFLILLISLILASLAGYGLYKQFSGDSDSKAYVYYVNFKPESDSVLKEVAELYTKETGIEVTILSPESGSYGDVLEKEFKKSSPPTLFVAGNEGTLTHWADYFYDLKGAKVVEELNTDAYNLYDKDGKGELVSIGYCYETFGIIVNLELLEKAGHKLDEIKDFDSLKKVVEDIHSKAKELGFDAFTSSGLDSSSSWRFTGHLANVPLFYESRDDGTWTETPKTIKGTYLKNYKNIWDLYIQNSEYSPSTLLTGNYNAEKEFGEKKAVFYQNGNWEYDALVNTYKLDPTKLTMIPLYAGVDGEEKAGLNSGTENNWAVNKKAPEEAIKATLDFMYWMVTDEQATELLAKTFGSIPFKKAVTPENVFLARANELVNEGKYTMTWAFNYVPEVDDWRADLVKVLNEYSISSTDENWALVEKAFIDNWEKYYKVKYGS